MRHKTIDINKGFKKKKELIIFSRNKEEPNPYQEPWHCCFVILNQFEAYGYLTHFGENKQLSFVTGDSNFIYLVWGDPFP